MKNIPLYPDYNRQVAKTPRITMKNRFYEKNPILSDGNVAVLARPGMRKFAEVGTGPIRKVFSSPGVFDGDLFIVSGTNLYRMNSVTLATTDLGVISSDIIGDVSMCATAPIGTEVPAYLWIAEGAILWIYTENGSAVGHLQASGTIANNDSIRLGDVYYKWTSGALTGGTGASGTPWLVKLGSDNTGSMQNLFNAVNATGASGTDYTENLTAHPDVQATQYNSTDMYFEAKVAGVTGNATVSTETGANLSFTGGTFSGGGNEQIRQVYVPDDVGAISVGHINSFVIVIPVQEPEIKGRFYYVEPGEKVIDPLNYATAERNPDGVHQVVVYGDMFWLLGENTTEPWITSGNPDQPVERYKGILFDRGSWAGTAIQVKDSLIVVDENGAVFQISGGSKRLSTPDVEERIRQAIQRA